MHTNTSLKSSEDTGRCSAAGFRDIRSIFPVVEIWSEEKEDSCINMKGLMLLIPPLSMCKEVLPIHVNGFSSVQHTSQYDASKLLVW